jgi:hypothetical protein
VAGCCEHGNEPSATIKNGAFLDSVGKGKLFKEDSAPWSYVVSGVCLMDCNPARKCEFHLLVTSAFIGNLSVLISL